MATTDALHGSYTGPSDREVVAVLQRMASARAQLMQAEQSAELTDPNPEPSKRVDELEEAHADLLWAQAEMLTSAKNLRRTKVAEAAVNREQQALRRHGYATFREYVLARTSSPTSNAHLTLARREYEEAQLAWERLQDEIEVAAPTMIIDLTDGEPRHIV
jgi:hypothetical protein